MALYSTTLYNRNNPQHDGSQFAAVLIKKNRKKVFKEHFTYSKTRFEIEYSLSFILCILNLINNKRNPIKQRS
jgi:hypothetical protein